MLKTNNPLVPFIVFFALVILLSIVVANSRNGGARPGEERSQERRENKRLTLVAHPPQERTDLPGIVAKREAKLEPPGVKSAPDLSKTFSDAFRNYELGKFKDAEELLRTLIVFEPGNAKALGMLGSLMLQQGRDQEAELFFRSQVKATPEDPAASEKLASALARQGRYEEAATCMRRVIELKPDSGSAFLTICGYNAQAGSIREAVDDFKQAYLRLGARIIQLSYDSNFDKIRDTPEFKEVIEKASMELARPMRIQSYQEEMPGIGMDAFPVPEDASQ